MIDLSELFACIAGSYPVRHYINRLTSGFIEGLTITDDGVIKVLRNGEWINYRMDDAVEVNDLRQEAEAHLTLSFDDEILSLFFTDKGELKDVELQSTDVIWGVSVLEQVVIQMEYQGEHYSSLYGGECVTRITSYEIIQGTDKVDYIDGEAIAVLYTQNHQKSIRSIDTRFRFDVN